MMNRYEITLHSGDALRYNGLPESTALIVGDAYGETPQEAVNNLAAEMRANANIRAAYGYEHSTRKYYRVGA